MAVPAYLGKGGPRQPSAKAAPAGRSERYTMWMPTDLDSRLMQFAGLAAMSAFIAPRFLPFLRPHARRLGQAVALIYLGLLAGVILIHLLGP